MKMFYQSVQTGGQRFIGSVAINGSTSTNRFWDIKTDFTDHYQNSGVLIFHMNGTTDYLEMYINLQGSGTATIVGNANNYFASGFSAVLVRAA